MALPPNISFITKKPIPRTIPIRINRIIIIIITPETNGGRSAAISTPIGAIIARTATNAKPKYAPPRISTNITAFPISFGKNLKHPFISFNASEKLLTVT
ncbi:MAG: hypothetical protein BWY74_02653 [Firmicutes bacterium ADurb.Bin419]|nr:MAG: hypothetical protein BWY74_02653 [Firmicutes bacterium ADurb.Bin419]